MRFSLSWLGEHLNTNESALTIAEKLTSIGLEVEEVIDRSQELSPFIVAEIVAAEPHPNADRLRVCRVNTGSQTLQVVCGAPNARAGIKVIFAAVGTTIPANGLTLKASKIRDVESNGMLCSAAEMGLSEDSEGIVELPAHAELGKPFAAFIGADDPIIDIAVTPNRGDALSIRGIARDVAAAGLGTLKPWQPPTLKTTGDNPYRLTLNTPDCPYFSVRTIRGVRNGASPDWLQRCIRAAGHTPRSLLVDVTNYILFTLGQPLHAFALDALSGQSLTIENSNGGEAFTTLKEQSLTLPQGAIIIRDDASIISLAGIMGGLHSACQDTTTDVVLEAALFNPLAIAKAGRALNLNTDARYRFERGVDAGMIQAALDAATALIVEYGGGQASPVVSAGKLPSPAAAIAFNPALVKQKTGVDVPLPTMQDVLTKAGLDVAPISDTLWHVTPPRWRHDISLAIDLVEDVIRLYGYEHIPATPHTTPTTPPLGAPRLPNPTVIRSIKHAAREEHIRQTLAQNGLHETVNWAFCDAALAAHFADLDASAALINPISQELSHLRPTAIIPLLQAVQRNLALGSKRGGLFEVGAQYEAGKPFAQSRVIAGVRWGARTNRHWSAAVPRAVDVFDAKADALAVIAAAGSNPDAPVTTADAPRFYHTGQSGRLKLGGKVVLGHFGAIHPRLLRLLDIDAPVVAFEVFTDALPTPKAKGTAKPALRLSPYPAVERDFAFIVHRDTPADAVLQAIRLVDKQLIHAVTLFDVYEGGAIPADHRSLGVTVTLQPYEATLTDLQIQEMSDRIIAAVKAKTGAALRG